METSRAQVTPWWRGKRGEWFVVGQAGLFLLVALGPRTAPWLPEWSVLLRPVSSILGQVLIVAGLVWIGAGVVQLGRSLTALPHPQEGSRLIDTGAFGLVRHPMYCGAIWVAVGWAFQTESLLTLAYAAVLALFFDVKASREERWLANMFPGYGQYQKRVRKLMPFVY